jgi:hypothetical protein
MSSALFTIQGFLGQPAFESSQAFRSHYRPHIPVVYLSAKRNIVIAGLFLFVLASAVWGLRLTAQQQTRKINTTPAPAPRVDAVKESDITGKTVHQPQIIV